MPDASTDHNAADKPVQPRSAANRGFGSRGVALFALLAAFLFLIFAAWWLNRWIGHEDKTKNTIDILLAGRPSSLARPLPGLPEAKTNLSPAELAFGEEQVTRMAKDRPEMGRYVSKTDAVWQFCARAFAGEAIGEPVLWENGMPEGDRYTSDHQDPFEGKRGYIRVRKVYGAGDERGRALSCEELWSCVVYEIENIRNCKGFDALYETALQGRMSREEWVRENSRLEYDALRRTAKDYEQLWLPLAETRQIFSKNAFWGTDIPATYEAWISQYRDPDGYPWDVYGRYYDLSIVPYVRSSKR